MQEDKLQQRSETPILLFSEDEKVIRTLEKLFLKSKVVFKLVRSVEKGINTLGTDDFGLVLWDLRFFMKNSKPLWEIFKERSPGTIHVGLVSTGTGKYIKATLKEGGLHNYIDISWDEEYIQYAIWQGLSQYHLVQNNRCLIDEVRKKQLRLKQVNADIEQKMGNLIKDFDEKRKSLAYENEMLIHQRTRIFEVFSMLTDINNEVSNHSRNVAALSALIAEALGLDRQEIHKIEQAALLHDIGKMNISLAVLKKNKSQLNVEEEQMVRSHVIRGQLLAELMGCSKEIAKIIRHHHEWYDGNGYPDGLKGDAIPIASRIIAVADTIENMTNANTPWNTFSLRRALWLIESKSSIIYDSKVFKSLLRVVNRWAQDVIGNADCQEEIVSLQDLKEGIRVSRDVISGTGILFITRGTMLTLKNIDKLNYLNSIDPLKTDVYICKETKKALHSST